MPAKLQIGGLCARGHIISGEEDLIGGSKCRACRKMVQKNYDRARKGLPPIEVIVQETTDQRKERIAEARRENTEISEQFGFDVTSLLTRPLAREPWDRFRHELKFSVKRPNCEGREAEFSDFKWEDRPTAEQAVEMCRDCPLFDLCADYAKQQQVTYTVMAGKVHHGPEEEEENVS